MYRTNSRVDEVIPVRTADTILIFFSSSHRWGFKGAAGRPASAEVLADQRPGALVQGIASHSAPFLDHHPWRWRLSQGTAHQKSREVTSKIVLNESRTHSHPAPRFEISLGSKNGLSPADSVWPRSILPYWSPAGSMTIAAPAERRQNGVAEWNSSSFERTITDIADSRHC